MDQEQHCALKVVEIVGVELGSYLQELMEKQGRGRLGTVGGAPTGARGGLKRVPRNSVKGKPVGETSPVFPCLLSSFRSL